MQSVDYNKYSQIVSKNREIARRKKKNNLIKRILTGIFIVFLVFIGIRMVTMEADLNFVLTYEIPKAVDLSKIGEDIKYGQYAVAVDGNIATSGGSEKPQATASTTKMILALAVIEKKPFKLGEDGETITITQEMYDKYKWYISHNGSNTKVAVGEKISEYDALLSTLLASSNNMADSLAIWAFGSLSEYQKYATEMLARFGLKDTTIGDKDASGYDEGTTSTASDLAKIATRVMKQPVLAKIVNTKTAMVPVAGTIKNTNLLLGKLGVSGVKTGYIGDPSGYCLASGYAEGNDIITVVVLGAPTRSQSFDDSYKIVQDLQGVLKSVELTNSGSEVGYYESWWTGKVSAKASKTVSGLLYDKAKVEYKFEDDKLIVIIDDTEYIDELEIEKHDKSPSIWQRFLHVFGWVK